MLYDWELVEDKPEYQVWESGRNNKRIAVFKNIFMILNLDTGINRNYNKKTNSQALSYAKKYMATH
jgi:hypothetical protein